MAPVQSSSRFGSDPCSVLSPMWDIYAGVCFRSIDGENLKKMLIWQNLLRPSIHLFSGTVWQCYEVIETNRSWFLLLIRQICCTCEEDLRCGSLVISLLGENSQLFWDCESADQWNLISSCQTSVPALSSRHLKLSRCIFKMCILCCACNTLFYPSYFQEVVEKWLWIRSLATQSTSVNQCFV